VSDWLAFAPLALLLAGTGALLLTVRFGRARDGLAIGRTAWVFAAAIALAQGPQVWPQATLLGLVAVAALGVSAERFRAVHGWESSRLAVAAALSLLLLQAAPGVGDALAQAALEPVVALMGVLILVLGQAWLAWWPLLRWSTRDGAPGLSVALPAVAATMLQVELLRSGFGDATMASQHAGWPGLLVPAALGVALLAAARAAMEGTVAAFTRDGLLIQLAWLAIAAAAHPVLPEVVPGLLAGLGASLVVGYGLLSYGQSGAPGSDGSANGRGRGAAQLSGMLVLLGAPLLPGLSWRAELWWVASEMHLSALLLPGLLLSTTLLGIALMRALRAADRITATSP